MSGYWHSGGRQCISWHRQTGLLSAQSRAGTGYVEWVTAFSVTWCDRQEVKPISKSVQIMPTQRTKESPHIRSPINHRSPLAITDRPHCYAYEVGIYYTMKKWQVLTFLYFITQTYKLDFLYIWIKELASPPRTIRCITIATFLIE